MAFAGYGTTEIAYDMFDLDQGYTGINQFWFGVQGAFNENSSALYGTASGGKGGEWDGDDYRFATTTSLGQQVNLSTRFQQPGTTSPGGARCSTIYAGRREGDPQPSRHHLGNLCRQRRGDRGAGDRAPQPAAVGHRGRSRPRALHRAPSRPGQGDGP